MSDTAISVITVEDEAESQEFPTLPNSSKLNQLDEQMISTLEKQLFPQVCQSNSIALKYMTLRNTITDIWLNDPLREVTLSRANAHLRSTLDNTNQVMFMNAVNFLTKYGFINIGRYQPSTFGQPSSRRKGHVGIVGAGISGLIAARKLKMAGFEVTMFEAKPFCGGRFLSLFDSACLELGCDVFTFEKSNPLSAVCGQINVKIDDYTDPVFSDSIPLYDFDGRVLPMARKKAVLTHVNNVLNICAAIVDHKWPSVQLPLDLEALIGAVMNTEEIAIKRIYTDYCELLEMNLKILLGLYLKREHCVISKRKICRIWRNSIENDRISSSREVLSVLKRYMRDCADLDRRIKKLEASIVSLIANEPAAEYMTCQDRRIFNWFLANFEAEKGVQLSEFPCRETIFYKDFFSPSVTRSSRKQVSKVSYITSALAEGLHIRYNFAVNRVGYEDGSLVTINGFDSENARNVTSKCDAVLVAVPIGVIKSGCIVFDPPLPIEKQTALGRINPGCFNRVFLKFRSVFWKNQRMFGYCSGSDKSRGECYLFRQIEDQPILEVLVSGAAGEAFERLNNILITSRCLTILSFIFGDREIQTPSDFLISRWGLQEHFFSSRSFYSKECKGSELTYIIDPLVNRLKQPKVYFAGEYAAGIAIGTAKGAALSGIREAVNIENNLLSQANGRK